MKPDDSLKKETLRDVPLFSEMDISQLREISEISRVEQFKKTVRFHINPQVNITRIRKLG